MRNLMARLASAALVLCLLAPAAAFAASATPAAAAGAPVTFPIRIADLSPDGKSMAAYDASKQLCVYDLATQKERACADLKAKKIALRPDDIVWSPDSTKIAFAEQAFQYLLDGDLWVMDAATGQLTDLTDDNYQGSFFPIGKDKDALKGKTIYEDVLPAWSPDSSKLAFSRSPIVNGEQAGNELAVISATGGEVTVLTKVSLRQTGLLYWGLTWAPDGKSIGFSYTGVDPDDPQSGVWIVPATGGMPDRVLETDPDLGRPIVLGINATGTTALILYIDAALSMQSPGEAYQLLDLKSGKTTVIKPPANAPKKAFIGGAVFSPDGTKLLSISKVPNPNELLVVRDLATGADETIFEAPYLVRTSTERGPDWADDGTIFVATSITEGIVLHYEAGPGSTPPSTAPTPRGPGG